MVEELLQDADTRMTGAVNSLRSDLDTFRTGRASPSLLDRLVIDMYGSSMKIIELASVSVPEPQQLLIKPYDPQSVQAIEKAILKSQLGLTPNSDGKLIRLFMPPLTEERRKDLSKQVGKRVEDGKVAIRNVRRDVLNDLREMKTEKMISEDEFFEAEKNLQSKTDDFIGKVDQAGKNKVEEITKI